jgi:hypothetical protein
MNMPRWMIAPPSDDADGPSVMDRAPADQTADRRQLDLFVDGRDAILIHDVVTGLLMRDVDRTEATLCRLGQDYPLHPDLGALTVLAETLTVPIVALTHEELTGRIEMTERRLVPAARRFLGGDASAFLRPVWQALAAGAADLPFAPAHPSAHRAWLCQQYGDWPGVRAAVDDEPRWRDTPSLRYWMGLAQHHLGAPEIATCLWLPLCWMDPLFFEAHAPTLPDPALRAAWLTFMQVLPFEEALADRAPAAAWFPAWLLVRHRALAPLFCVDDILDAGDGARVFRHLLVLLPLEQRGLSDEVVRQRRALRQLDESFFRHYMAALGDRRWST